MGDNINGKFKNCFLYYISIFNGILFCYEKFQFPGIVISDFGARANERSTIKIPKLNCLNSESNQSAEISITKQNVKIGITENPSWTR